MATLQPNEYLSRLNERANRVHQETLQAPRAVVAMGKAIQLTTDLSTLAMTIKDRRESQMLKAAAREIEFSILCMNQGAYRQGYGALRLALELWVAGIYFSAHELELRGWLNDQRDIVWNQVNHEESGFMSIKFVGPSDFSGGRG